MNNRLLQPEGNSMKNVFKALILALLLTACGTEAGKFTVPANAEIGAKVSSEAGKTGKSEEAIRRLGEAFANSKHKMKVK